MENRIDNFAVCLEDELLELDDNRKPRPVVMQLHVRFGELRCRVMPRNVSLFQIRCGRLLYFGIPPLSGTAANAMLGDEEVRALAWQIVQGCSENNGFSIYTDEAKQAIERLRNLVHDYPGERLVAS